MEDDIPAESSLAAQIAIHPSSKCARSFRIIFDLDPRFNPSARITYLATIPSDSEVFCIVAFGELEDLSRTLRIRPLA